MWKRIMAIFLILVLCVSVMWFANPLAPVTKVSADTYRSGFSIVPEKEDASGVLLDSGFILSSQSPLTIDYIKENVSMREGNLFSITPAAEGRFILKPTESLEQNKIYFIDVKAQAGNTVSFAFQTKRDFTVLGSLPDNMSSYVPVDTGIELYFSYPDVENISKHFEITPKVNGRFETNGYTTVFIPKKLKAGTVYNVTIKKGLTAANKSVSLAEDYTFSFETSPDESATADPYKGDLYINRGWIEYGTTEVPAVGFDLYLRERIDSAEVTLNLYRFETLDDFIKAIKKKEETPYWAYYASSRNRIDTSKLESVLEFKQSFNLQRYQQKYMMFPKALEHGYYLVELSTDELSTQAFLQISDITAYTITDKDHTLFWLNDLKTKSPVKGTEIFDFELGKGFLSGSSGLVEIPNIKNNSDDDITQKLYRVTTTEGNVSIINAGYPYYDTYRDNGSLNWRYIQTDRTLYKPNDTVEFWGFVKSRIDDSYPNDITVELASGGYYYPMRSNIMSRFLPFLSNPLETLKLKTEGGFYEGNIRLPAVDPGSYTITVKDGDKILSSSYFRVENYIKPQYKLEITSDLNAVFAGEEITFTIKASFFEGTPVANVPLNYYINGYNDNINGQGVTDKNGILEIKHTPKYYTNMQGESYAGINVSAQFPETGEINEYYNFRVFANDINIQSKGEIKDNKGTIDLTVNEVVLDTLNDDDNTNDNYLGKTVAGQKLSLSLVHRTWEKIETGDEYDAINKVVRKTYEYREKKTPAGTATLTTGHDGTARYEFSVKPNDEGYYTAEVITSDTNNRTIKNEIWVYNNSGHRGYPNDYEYFMLKTDKESYKAGETVNAQIINNKDEPLKDMPTLFVEARNGIQNYQVVGQPALSMAFPEDYAPNYYLHGIAFNGKSYIRTNASIIYDYNEKKIDLSIKTDKDAYKPGDNMTISLEAKDINGKPVPAKVNISLVDEALLKLSGQYIDPLAQLYSWIGDGIISSASTRDDSGGPIRLAGGVNIAFAEDAKSDSAMPAPAPSAAPESPAAAMDNGKSVSVRSEFKDTALFKTITLSPNGLGSYTFKLPDNVTSFSLAAAAVSADLYAGSEIQSAKVTMPFFINDALSLDYLEGDKPYVGLTAYGDGLDENEKVNFELTIKELPLYNKTAEAKVYERVNLPLPTLTEGIFTVIMTARSESGKADALSRTITVYNSYRTIETVKQNKVTAGMKLEAGKSGITTLIFTDAGRGSLISALHNLSWEYGKRLDQKLVSNYARSLLKELIKNDAYYIEPIEVNPTEYKNEDGGYGILPYAGSDMNFTALITPLLKDIMDTAPLKMYFYNAVMSEKGVQAAALFALAELEEPVLLDLNRAAQVENLSLDEYIYLGMAYEALGDLTKANEIYMRRVAPELERKDPYIRVKVNKSDTDTSYRQTALVAAYAASINSPDASKLFAFVQNNYSKTQYVGVEKALYLSEMVDNLPDTNASVSYTMGGKAYDVELSNGFSEVVKVPSININDLKITKVTGDVSVLSMFTGSYTENVKNDSGLTLSRKYYDAATGKEKTTFAADDLVKVEITYTIDKSAIDNTYEISDYAPAGLKPLDNPWSYGVRDALGCWYRQFDGQKVTFVVGKYDEKYPPKPLVYYARVASPGEYIAEGSIAQGSMVKSSIVTIKDAKIVIEP